MQLNKWHEKFMSVRRGILSELDSLHLIASAARRIFMEDLANELDVIANTIEEAIAQLDQATGSMIRDEVDASISAMHETLVTCVTGVIGHIAEETEKEKSNVGYRIQ